MNEWPKQPLIKDEAHEEANMMKVEAGYGGMVLAGFSEPRTAAQYDAALLVVEEIKQMAEEEPLTRKVLSNIARLAVKSGYGVLTIINILGLIDFQADQVMIDNDREQVLEKIKDASARLKELKDEAMKLGEYERD